MTDTINDIKKALKENKAVIGTKQTLDTLKLGRLKKVYVTSNCPDRIKKDIELYSKMTSCEVEQLAIPNDELGVVCKKQFSISVMGLRA